VEPHREVARELLALVGMAEFADRRPRELSGGMRQRVAICRALVHGPPLLLMDEPFGALDSLTREELNDELARVTQQAGTTVVFITHSIDEAVFLSDRVLVMSPRPGRVVADVAIALPRPRTAATRAIPEFNRHVVELRAHLAGGAKEGAEHA
jgi:NitT/TauT family transport system ATP-binding protein